MRHSGIHRSGARRALCRIVDSMNHIMHHRGPDDQGLEVVDAGDRQVGLGACRLAIQDLSSAGRQPMRDPRTGNLIVFNGEVYNFRELRADLELEGAAFRSWSDTEVVLRAYAAWGLDEMLRRLRGMYAFGIWDAQARHLVVARDRLGVKPLYYAETTEGFLFSSEVRALLASGLVPPRLSEQGLAGYLALGAVQEPFTLVEGVRSLPPGCFGIVSPTGLSVTTYWSLLDCFHRQAAVADYPTAVSEVREYLQQSVRLRLLSDAPVGVFLSGGVDSTSVVALAARVATRNLRTVSVVFPESDFSEARYIREVAEQFETEHTQIELSGSDLLDMLPRALAAMDQPTFDGVNTFVVAGHARASG